MKQALINFLQNKRILILGLGREGRSALNFIAQNLPSTIANSQLGIADLNPIDLPQIELDAPLSAEQNNLITLHSGENYLEACRDYDIIIKSPGVAIKNYLDDTQKAKITSLTDLFIRFCPNPIVGITGTKGKSTTASLMYHILHECGLNAQLVGNIGKPCFDIIDKLRVDSIIVFEMSAHQLEFIQASPHAAILLNLYEEHLDHYVDADAYYDAKKNIFRHQKPEDYLVYGHIFQHCRQEEIDHAPAEHKYDLYHDAHIDPAKIQTELIGDHNLHDIYACIYLCQQAFDLEEVDILRAIASFKGLPHRLELVGTYNDITFYNSSIATACEATIENIKALADKKQGVDTIILGGMDRGLDYHPLVDYIRHSSNIRNVLLLPNTEQSFERIFSEEPYAQKLCFCKDMAEAVDLAFKLTADQHICLLSPAAASYGFYKNFEERGDHFKALVRSYHREPQP